MVPTYVTKVIALDTDALHEAKILLIRRPEILVLGARCRLDICRLNSHPNKLYLNLLQHVAVLVFIFHMEITESAEVGPFVYLTRESNV